METPMTLPDTPFVCKNIDVIWWCVTHDLSTKVVAGCREGWVQLGGRDYSCRVEERGLVDLSEVISAEVETAMAVEKYWGPGDYYTTIAGAQTFTLRPGQKGSRYKTPWQPVVSDKE
jgi:hypothetical protein